MMTNKISTFGHLRLLFLLLTTVLVISGCSSKDVLEIQPTHTAEPTSEASAPTPTFTSVLEQSTTAVPTPTPLATSSTAVPSPSPTITPVVNLTATAAPTPTATPLRPTQAPVEINCIESGDHTDIQNVLQGKGDVAVLCRNSTFLLTDTIRFTAPEQQIFTEGLPEDDSRALLVVSSPDLDTAVDGESHDHVQLKNVEIDGGRVEFGFGNAGLMEFGGTSNGQIIEYVRAYEPRGWSILVLNHGHDLLCNGPIARNNHFGPGGNAKYVIADGISLACRNSIIENNLIVDVSDGGIVIFQAPGSVIRNNVIRAENRIMFYGIAMGDYGPFDGDFTGTIVSNNTIDAAGSLIRHGINMGPYNGCIPNSEAAERSRGAVVRDNTLTGSHMGFGYMVSGVENWVVIGNIDLSTTEPFLNGGDCFEEPVSDPGGFQYNANLAQGELQSEFKTATFTFATVHWPLNITANMGCFESLIGQQLLEEIRVGAHADPWIAIEESPNGRKLEKCLDEFDPPIQEQAGPDVQVGIEICEPRCLEVTLINLSESHQTDLTDAFFQVDNFRSECVGMPSMIEPLGAVTCRISDYLSSGFQVINWYGVGKAPGTGGWGIELPDDRF